MNLYSTKYINLSLAGILMHCAVQQSMIGLIEAKTGIVHHYVRTCMAHLRMLLYSFFEVLVF